MVLIKLLFLLIPVALSAQWSIAPASIDSLNNWWTPDSVRPALDLQGGALADSVGVLKFFNQGTSKVIADTTLTRNACTGCDTARYRTNRFNSTKPSVQFGASSTITAMEITQTVDQPIWLIQEDNTVAMMIKLSPTVTLDYAIDFGFVSSSTTPAYMFRIDNRTGSGNPMRLNYVILDASPSPLSTFSTDSSFVNDTWFTVFLVCDSTVNQEGRIYINGVLDTTQALAAALDTDANVGSVNAFTVGRRTLISNEAPLDGEWRHLIMYRKILSQAEITGLHNWMMEIPNPSGFHVRRRGLHRS